MLNFIAAIGSAAAGGGGSFESIATATGTGSSGTITFSSIPGTYQHLQLRYFALSTSGTGGLQLNVNSDTASNYARHQLSADGSSVSAFGAANVSAWYVEPSGFGIQDVQPAVGIIDIHDYSNTSKFKTMRCVAGIDINGSGGGIILRSCLWRSTNAITSITLALNAGQSFTTSTRFALYGIKGA